LGLLTLGIVFGFICRRSQRLFIPFDPEIEATARRQSGARKRQYQVVMVERYPRVLRDYILPQAIGLTSPIVNPTIEANKFELWLALISFVEQNQFGRVSNREPSSSPLQLPSKV